MLELVINRGIPGCGKSTYANAWVTAAPNRVRVNRDDIRFQMYGVYFGKPIDENIVTKIEDSMIMSALRTGNSVIVDDCNIEERYVNRFAHMAFRCGATFRVQEFNTTLGQALENNRRRRDNGGRFVPEDVIISMHNRLKPIILPYFPIVEPYVPDLSKPPCFLYDLDGTVAHTTDRSPYDFSRVKEDVVDDGIVDIINSVAAQGIQAIGFSGRDDICYDDTLDWLYENKVCNDELFMRKTGDKRKDSIVKLEMFNEHIRNNYNVWFVLDDRDQVVDIWRLLGLKCLQVEPGDF
jgi:predicted kinase